MIASALLLATTTLAPVPGDTVLTLGGQLSPIHFVAWGSDGYGRSAVPAIGVEATLARRLPLGRGAFGVDVGLGLGAHGLGVTAAFRAPLFLRAFAVVGRAELGLAVRGGPYLAFASTGSEHLTRFFGLFGGAAIDVRFPAGEASGTFVSLEGWAVDAKGNEPARAPVYEGSIFEFALPAITVGWFRRL